MPTDQFAGSVFNIDPLRFGDVSVFYYKVSKGPLYLYYAAFHCFSALEQDSIGVQLPILIRNLNQYVGEEKDM